MRPAIAALIDHDREALKESIQGNAVQPLYVFGSSVNGLFMETSDVLVDMDAPDEAARRMLINVWNGFEAMTGDRWTCSHYIPCGTSSCDRRRRGPSS